MFRGENAGQTLAGVAGTYAFPNSVTVNGFGLVTAVGADWSKGGVTMSTATGNITVAGNYTAATTGDIMSPTGKSVNFVSNQTPSATPAFRFDTKGGYNGNVVGFFNQGHTFMTLFSNGGSQTELEYWNGGTGAFLGGLLGSGVHMQLDTFTDFSPTSNALASLGLSTNVWSSTNTRSVDSDSGQALNLGTTNANAINIGNGSILNTITGGLTQLGGNVSITGSSTSTLDTGAGGTVNLGTTGATSAVNIGNTTAFMNFNYATVALGGGSNATLGGTGGSGPATIAQNSWHKVKINGTVSFIPIWR